MQDTAGLLFRPLCVLTVLAGFAVTCTVQQHGGDFYGSFGTDGF